MNEPLDIDDVITKLTLDEKIALIAGKDFWHSAPTARLNIPSFRNSDSPVGVRGITAFDGVPGSVFPCTTGMASSFDDDLMFEVAAAIGLDARAKGVHNVYGPTLNMMRSPLGGRNFEAFGEDPLLVGRMGSAFVRGLQSRGVAACPKHWVCNDQESDRYRTDVLVSTRALREIYMKPFEICIREGNPWSMMVAYNKVNGEFCTDSHFLLTEVLRKEWKWSGLTLSDYFAVSSVSESVNAGLNLEMPGGPFIMRNKSAIRMISTGRVSEATLDENVRSVLRMVNRAIASGIGFDVASSYEKDPYMLNIMRRAASDAMVLLKNDRNLLPLSVKDSKKTYALIGSNVTSHTQAGGGSVAVLPTHVVTIWDGVRNVLGDETNISFAQGCQGTKLLPPLLQHLRVPSKDNAPGLLVEMFNDNPWKEGQEGLDPVHSAHAKETRVLLIDNIPEKVNTTCWTRFSSTFVPNESGEWEFGMVVAAGQGDLYIDGVQVIDNSTQQTPSPLFACAGSIEEVGHFTVEAGKSYSLEIRFSNQRPVPGQTIPMGRGAIEVGARRIRPKAELVSEAVEVAKQVDVVIVAVGLNADWESEGYDRENLRLPPGTDELVGAVLDVRSDSIVVLQSGTPLELPWIEKCSTLLQAHYGGLEFGNGLADIIFGKVNPSARLSMTYPFKASHNPATYNWGDEFGESRYGEGVFVGYRHYEATDREVMFPFGYGLSYHSSEIVDVAIKKKLLFTKPVDTFATCDFTLENLSEIPGREVVQLYISPPDSKVRRPVKELKTYCKLALKAHERKRAELNIPLEAFSYFNARLNKWHVEKGTYKVLLGFSSQNIRAEREIEIEEPFSWLEYMEPKDE